MKRFAGCLLVLLGLPAATAWAAGVDLNLNGDAVRGGVLFDMQQRNLELDFNLLHNEENGDVAAVGLQVADALSGGSDRWGVGVGIRLFYCDLDSGAEGGALSIGGHLRYRWPNRVVLSGQAYWAPNVVTTQDLDRFTEFGVRLGYQVIDAAQVYVGARTLRARLDGGGTTTIDDGAFLGIQFHW